MGVFYVALDLEYYFSNYMKWYNINNNWLHLFNGVAEYEYSTDVTNLRLKHTFSRTTSHSRIKYLCWFLINKINKFINEKLGKLY